MNDVRMALVLQSAAVLWEVYAAQSDNELLDVREDEMQYTPITASNDLSCRVATRRCDARHTIAWGETAMSARGTYDNTHKHM